MRVRSALAVFCILLLAACSGGSSAETTRAPATDSTTAPTEPSSDTTTGSTEAPGTTEAEGETEELGSGRIGIGGWSISQIPTAMAIERVNELGHDLEPVVIDGTSALMQAASQGEIDVTTVSAAATMAAIDAGLDFKFFLQGYYNEFVLVSRAEYDSCESLDGKRVAIHSPTDISGLLTKAWFEANCPDAEPNVQIVEGSENRLAGLLQDQLEASPLDIGDSIQVELARPDDFHVLAAFAEDFPLVHAVLAAQPEWITQNRQLVEDLIGAHLDVWAEFYEDRGPFVETAIRYLPELEPDVIERLAEEYAAREVFPIDGGLYEEETQYTLDFFAEAGDFQNIGSFADIADRSYLDAVLAER